MSRPPLGTHGTDFSPPFFNKHEWYTRNADQLAYWQAKLHEREQEHAISLRLVQLGTWGEGVALGEGVRQHGTKHRLCFEALQEARAQVARLEQERARFKAEDEHTVGWIGRMEQLDRQKRLHWGSVHAFEHALKTTYESRIKHAYYGLQSDGSPRQTISRWEAERRLPEYRPSPR